MKLLILAALLLAGCDDARPAAAAEPKPAPAVAPHSCAAALALAEEIMHSREATADAAWTIVAASRDDRERTAVRARRRMGAIDKQIAPAVTAYEALAADCRASR